MQIKDEHDDASSISPSEENEVPIYSSLESLLIIPPSMSRELNEKALKTQLFLDKWSHNRRNVVRQLDAIAEKLINWERGCAISTTVGSSVGIVSGAAVIGGLVLMPPVAIAGLIVGTAAGVSNLATGVTKWAVFKRELEKVQKMLDEDKRLFEELLASRSELMDVIRRIMEDEEFLKHFESEDDIEKLKAVLGASVTGITGLGARYAIASMGRLSSSLVKGVLHSVAVIGIVIDGVTLALSVKTLKNDEVPEFVSTITEVSAKMELIRQKVVKHFLNQDVWDAHDDDDEEEQEEEEEGGPLSECESVEIISPIPSQLPSMRQAATSSPDH
uniref:Uncharacterized protein n=1 Tax=Caenorhabditis japonica TaxID=281687 RepID=A0A8R1DYH0_CAEJA